MERHCKFGIGITDTFFQVRYRLLVIKETEPAFGTGLDLQ